jgi:hypothetical protein
MPTTPGHPPDHGTATPHRAPAPACTAGHPLRQPTNNRTRRRRATDPATTPGTPHTTCHTSSGLTRGQPRDRGGNRRDGEVTPCATPRSGWYNYPNRVGRMTHVDSEPRLHCQCKLFPLTMSHYLVILSETPRMCRWSQVRTGTPALGLEQPGRTVRRSARARLPGRQRASPPLLAVRVVRELDEVVFVVAAPDVVLVHPRAVRDAGGSGRNRVIASRSPGSSEDELGRLPQRRGSRRSRRRPRR